MARRARVIMHATIDDHRAAVGGSAIVRNAEDWELRVAITN